MQQRILLGCSSPIDHGSGILAYTRELITGLLASGVQVHVAAPPPSDRSWATERGVQLFDTPSWGKQAETVRKLVRYIAEQDLTGVINSDNPCVQVCARALRVPMVSVGHMSQSSIATLACHNHEFVDHVVAISSDMQLVFLREYGVPAHKCHLVPGGVDVSSIVKPKAPGQPLNVIFAGGNNKQYKGADLIDVLVRRHGAALSGIHLDWFGQEKHPDVSAKMSGISVSYAGRLPRDVFLEKMWAADVLLFPSRYEGCPLSLQLQLLGHLGGASCRRLRFHQLRCFPLWLATFFGYYIVQKKFHPLKLYEKFNKIYVNFEIKYICAAQLTLMYI